MVLGRDGRGCGRYVQRWPQQQRLLLAWWGDGLGWKGLFMDIFLHGHGPVGYSSLSAPLSYVLYIQYCIIICFIDVSYIVYFNVMLYMFH